MKFVEQFERLEEALVAFPDEPVTTADYVEAARISNRCMSSGVLTGNTDSLICAVALLRGMEILTTDKDFNYIAEVVPIQLH